MKPPHFWKHGLDPYSREAAPFLRAMLTPLANIYAWAGARRIKTTESYRCGAPVICVGNVTVGGTGKSPVVAALLGWFTARGIRAASLSRGYKGKLKGPCRVDPASHSSEDVGDEPMMLALKGEAWIGADRAAAARAMKKDGVELIIMDDGFQNPGLHKDHSILVIDTEAPFGNGHVIPKGPLREPVSSALARANSVLLMGTGPQPAELKTNAPVLRAHIQPKASPPRGPLIAFAGIGRPQKVFDALTAHGAELSETVPYPDHHTYSDSDIKYLMKLAEERGAQLVTTEKDHARLLSRQPSEILDRITPWPVEAVFEKPEQLEILFAPILETLGK